MPIKIEILDQVPEDKLVETVGLFGASAANIVTAVNDGQGTFYIEATFISPGAQGGITLKGMMSTFGGPHDPGVGASEGLALYNAANMGTAPAGLFLATQPPGTTGLAKRLNPDFDYLACRWNYSVTPQDFLRMNVVTVSANGKSVAAHPADWGPNIATRRVADLSPGLASALGLGTNDTCNLQIPLPGGAAIPIPAGRPATGVDVAAINAAKLPADMTHALVVMTTSANTTYWVVNVLGQNEGGQTLMRQIGANAPELLRSATVILPIEADAQVPAAVATELNKAVEKEPEATVDPADPAPVAGDDINAKVFAKATAFVGHDTRNVPLTDNGKLACAWAVNEVVRLALHKPISTNNGGGNGLTTDGIFAVLNAHHTRLTLDGVTAGAIVISPTVEGQHGHVGIVGRNPGGAVGNTQIMSNSTHDREFEQNYTIDKWTRDFTNKGLAVLFFALKGDQFV
jgi:hypothetical protein